MDQTLEKCSGRQDRRLSFEDFPDLSLNTAHVPVLDDDTLDAALTHRQVCGGLKDALAARTIRRLIGLRAPGANRGTLARVKKPELDSSLINRQAHLAAQRIHLAHQVALADAADRGIAGHLSDVVEIERQYQGLGAHPRRGERGLDPGVPGADHDDVVLHG